MALIKAEYIWLDGCKPTAWLRSKTKILNTEVHSLPDIPEWAFDGSSTKQAEGKASDCILKPVHMVADPVRGEPHVLVLCEVLRPDGSVHESNTRAHIRDITQKFIEHEPLFGIEQEYTLYKGMRPLAWPAEGAPAPQGPYYCGVGADKACGRELVEEHLEACLSVGLHVSGVNAEVMPGQWEFQVGAVGALEVADELWLCRWILQRLGEKYGITVSFAPKPILGDWNGAGAHTNFSTKAMRAPGGIEAVEQACRLLATAHNEHIAVYGFGNEARLTGKYETCPISEFRWGVSDRGASIRIPIYTAKNGFGYLEDRRPAANMDPYKVCARLIETVCGGQTVQYSQPVAVTA